MRSSIYLAAIKAWNPNTSSEVTFYFSSAPWLSGASDSPANTWYDGRIKQPAWIRRTAFGNKRTSGRATVSFGELVLINVDGGLDYLADYYFHGRAITLSVGVLNTVGSPTWTTVVVGKIEQANYSMNEWTFQIRDRLLDLDVPLQTTRYAGSGGLEGDAAIAGLHKVLTFGYAYNVAPVMISSSSLVFQVHAGAITSANVYDGGVGLTQYAPGYATEADMWATAPPAGGYKLYLAGGCFRLGSSVAYEITADSLVSSTLTSGDLLYDIAVNRAGISSGDVSTSDKTTLNAATSSAYFGFFADREMSCADAMDQVATSIGAYYGFDANGLLRMSQLTVPSGSAVATLTSTDIIAIERSTSRDEDSGIPIWRTRLGYKRNFVTQTSGLATSVSASRRGLLGQEYRYTEASSAIVKTAHPSAKEIHKDTLLIDGHTTEAYGLLDVYKVVNDTFEVTARLNDAALYGIKLCDVVAVDLARYGMSGGRLFRVIGIMLDVFRGRIDLTLWGPA